jgi:hypothetical protein
MKFDPTQAAKRLEKLWKLGSTFGRERSAYGIYLDEIVSDRFVLVNGLQLLHDELQFAGLDQDSDVAACGADLSLPSVCTTLAHTNCGDRIHQGEATTSYEHVVAARFATRSEIGEYKLEAFSPTGGGTDDGGTLAHVTVAHQIDEPLRRALYGGNAQSYMLVNIDLKTHCGRMELEDGRVVVGRTQESRWREPRAACGAIVGTLGGYSADNAVHRRIRADLGEENYAFLTQNKVKTDDGVDVTACIAAAIVAVQGMINTARALGRELDERGVGHTTASITMNRPHMDDTIIYLARCTVFGGKIRTQGLGTDARKYSARFVEVHDDKRLLLAYDGHEIDGYPVVESSYEVLPWRGAAAH